MSESDGKRCECHECTQARYRGSFQHQLDQAFRPTPNAEAQLAAKVDLGDAERRAYEKRIDGLEAQLAAKDAVIDELTQALKMAHAAIVSPESFEIEGVRDDLRAALALAADAAREGLNDLA